MKPKLTVQKLYKTFYIPEERRFNIKELFIHPFKRIRSSSFEVLKDINFEVNPGDFVGVIGTNGSGKSTLLKIIAGIYSPTKGKIKINGKIIPFLELGVGFNPELTARENIYLNGIILGMTRKEVKEKFDEIVEFSELNDFLDVQVKNFSSGMYARLAFAIAIQAEGSIYILDEILSVGDFRFQLKSLNYINQLILEKKTILFVSHDMNAIRSYCNKIFYINNGELKVFNDVNAGIEAYISETTRTQQLNTLELKTDSKIQTTSKILSISSVKFIDKNGKQRDIFMSEEDIIIQINYKILTQESLPLLNIGIAIYDEKNERLVFGTNTKIEKVEVDPKDYRQVEFHLDKVMISEGIYSVRIAFVNYYTDERIALKEKAGKFSITKSSSTVGDTIIHTKIYFT